MVSRKPTVPIQRLTWNSAKQRSWHEEIRQPSPLLRKNLPLGKTSGGVVPPPCTEFLQANQTAAQMMQVVWIYGQFEDATPLKKATMKTASCESRKAPAVILISNTPSTACRVVWIVHSPFEGHSASSTSTSSSTLFVNYWIDIEFDFNTTWLLQRIFLSHPPNLMPSRSLGWAFAQLIVVAFRTIDSLLPAWPLSKDHEQ